MTRSQPPFTFAAAESGGAQPTGADNPARLTPMTPAPMAMSTLPPAPDLKDLASADAEHLATMDAFPPMSMLLSGVMRAAMVQLAARGFEVAVHPLQKPCALLNGRVVALEVPVSLTPGTASSGTAGAATKPLNLLVRVGVMVRVSLHGGWDTDLMLWACLASQAGDGWLGLSTGSTPVKVTLAVDYLTRDQFTSIADMRAALARLEVNITRGGASLEGQAVTFAGQLMKAVTQRRVS